MNSISSRQSSKLIGRVQTQKKANIGVLLKKTSGVIKILHSNNQPSVPELKLNIWAINPMPANMSIA